MNRLDRSIDALVDSYDLDGLVNHPGGANLPNREAIEDILLGLESLAFPGFRENARFDHNDLRLITAEKTNHLARERIGEVEKSVTFSFRNGDLAVDRKAAMPRQSL